MVVVAVDAAGVNPVDAGNRGDPSWAQLEPPYVVGYEFSGRAVHASEGYAAGDPVWGVLPVRGTRWGAYAEQLGVPAGLVAPKPVGLDALSAGCTPLTGLTALQTLDRLHAEPGSWLLVHGATGGVGQLLVQFARARGIHVAAATRANQRLLVEELGVELWLDRSETDVPGRLGRMLGWQFDGVVDLVGGLLLGSLPFIREGGHAATIVSLTGDFDEAIDRNISIHGVLVRPGRAELDRLADVLGRTIRPRIRGVYPLAEAQRAHERLANGGVDGKLVLQVQEAD
jgi:NADPH2:quinone reductase